MDNVLHDLAERIRRREVVFFLGAGASCASPSNLPTSLALLKPIAERIALPSSSESKEHVANKIATRVRFEVFVQALTTICHVNAIGLLRILESGLPNFNHEFIANLAALGLCSFVITTNFDSLLERALVQRGIENFELWHLNKHFNHSCIESKQFKILKLHGSLCDLEGRKCYESIAIAANQVGKSIPPSKRKVLREILKRYDMVFIGYSGLDDFDLLPLILTTESDRAVFWIRHQQCKKIKCIHSVDLSARESAALNNDELIVVSRKGGVLLQGSTDHFMSLLAERIFQETATRTTSHTWKPDFSYLEQWEKEIELDKHNLSINGLLFQALEDHKEAINYFDKVSRASQDFEIAQYSRAVCLRRDNQIDAARNQLKQLIVPHRWSRNTKMKALVELGLLETERTNLNFLSWPLAPRSTA